VIDTYYYAQSGARFTGETKPVTVTGSPSEWFRREARLARALGDEVTARKWDRQADMEETYERGQA
jgi:hypothetical protein